MHISSLQWQRTQLPGRSLRALIFSLATLLPPVLVIVLLTVSQIQPQATPATGRGASRVSAAPAPESIQWYGSWQRTALTGEVDALVMDPHQQGRLFAGTPAGVWVSEDRGVTWRQDAAGPHGVGIMSFAAAPSSTALFAGGSNGVVYMRDLGSSRGWHDISPSLGQNPVFSLAASPVDGSALLAGTVGALYRGTRIGAAWHWQLVAHTGDSSVPAIAWAPWDPELAYASIFGSSPPMLRSVDGGYTWRPDTHGLPSSLPAVAMLARTSPQRQVLLSTMGGGVWLREPDGTWRDISGGLPEHHAMPLAAGAPGNADLFAGTMGSGVYMKQGAMSWRHLGNGHDLSGAQYTILSLVRTGGPQPALVAGTALGVYRYVLKG